MKKLNQILLLIAIVATTFAVNAQDSNNPWMVKLGTNAVDFYPTGQDQYTYIGETFGKDFFNTDHYNAAYIISDVRVGRYLADGFSLVASVKANKITQIGDLATTKSFTNLNLDLKYNVCKDAKALNPYIFAGGGYTWLEKADAGSLNGGLGLEYWFTENIGFFVETAYKHTFDNNVLPYFQHSAGIAVKFGGVDTDGDGIFDKDDACPNVKGPIQFNGCPDSDGDGIVDSKDDCPNVAGIAALNGCPDTDKDGIADKNDKCPKVAGPRANNGCPYADTDKDGVLDKDDNCPKVAGTKANKGCPEVTKEVQAQLNEYAKVIYFDSGKSTFKPKTIETLDAIVVIMKKFPTAKFNVEGHTDSMGSSKFNQKLSQSRAEAVVSYLGGHGVQSSMTAIGYGEDKPIASNRTRSGRAQNRRVEINLVK